MTDRPKFFDDLAGVAGGAMSALAGLREELESTLRARVEEMVRKLDLVHREDLEAFGEMAANARTAQTALEARVAALESRVAELEAQPGPAASAAAQASSSASATAPVRPVERPADDAAEGSPS